MAKDVRADLGKPVEPVLSRLRPEQRAIAASLHRLILSAVPSLQAGLKWGMPFYSRDGMVCFIMVAKRHVSLGFVRGAALRDPKKLLQAGSSKTMRLMKFGSPKEIPAPAVKAFVKQSVRLNREAK